MAGSESIAERWVVVADGFSAVAESVESDQWTMSSPCEGWAAVDVIRHLVDWVPEFVHSGAGIELAVDHSVDDAPAAAWHDLEAGIRSLVSDPALAVLPFRHPMAGDHRLDEAIEIFVLNDVLVHTWDLATAVGREVELHPPSVAACLAGFAAADALVASGHYSAAVSVSSSADAQTRLIAASGRRPSV